MPFVSNSVSDFVDTLTDQPSCHHCTGRGWLFHTDHTAEPCLCGGTDEDRIEIDDSLSALAVIEEFQGIDLYLDECVFEAVRHRLGHNAFTDDALALIAEEYQRRARQADRVKYHNRRIRSSRPGELH